MVDNNILDFDDFAKPTDFKFANNIYRIPAFSKKKIEELMKFNNEFIAGADIDLDEEDASDDETFEKTSKFFDMQDKFLAMAVLKKTDDKFIEVTEEELAEWPVRVKTQVMAEVTKQMSTVAGDEDVPPKS